MSLKISHNSKAKRQKITGENKRNIYHGSNELYTQNTSFLEMRWSAAIYFVKSEVYPRCLEHRLCSPLVPVSQYSQDFKLK